MKPHVLVVLATAACTKPPAPTAPTTAAATVAVAPPAADACPTGGWSSASVVDGAFESGFEPTIAWNRATGEPVLFDVAQADSNKPTHWLRLVERSHGQWLEPRTLEGMVSGVMAAAVDDQGLVHLAFTRFDATGEPFLGTVGPGSPWKVDGPIEPGLGFIEDRMSMLLGPGTDVLVAYSDHASRTIKIAARHGGAWTLETVATGATLWRDHTLVRDSRGGLHLVAGDWSAGDVRVYSRAADGTWPFIIVGEHAVGASLAIDRTDQLHVSWIDWEAKALNHSTGKAGGPFETSRVAAGSLGNDSSIGVAANGTVSIAYDQRDCADLHLATHRPGRPGSAWTTEIVDTAGQVGAYASLVVDDKACIHIVYSDSDAWDLKYASRCPP